MIIGISGRCHAGKTEVGKFLVEEEGMVRIAFADALKNAVSNLFRIPLDDLYAPEKKNTVHPIFGVTYREIMQLFGTEAIRENFGRDFWTKLMAYDMKIAEEKAGKKIDWVIDDVRFPEEAVFIQQHGGKILKIVRPNNPLEVSTEHESEQQDDLYWDSIISNDGAIELLRAKTRSVLNSWKGERHAPGRRPA